MAAPEKKLASYDPQNLRYRRAFIRDRLAEIKSEREALAHERDAIDVTLRKATMNGSKEHAENDG